MVSNLVKLNINNMIYKKITVFLLFLLLNSTSFAQNDAHFHFAAGKNHYAKGELFLAIDAFNRAILINRNFARAYTERAKVNLALHKYDEANLDHNKALEINSEFAHYDDYAQINSLKEDTKGFVFFYNDCISGASLQNDSTISEYETCMDDKYLDTSKYHGHAYSKYMAGNYQDSEIDAKNLLLFDSSNIYANYLLGSINEKNGNYEEAIKYFSKAIKLDSTFYINYYRRAVVYKKMKKFDLAIADLYKAEKSNQSSELVYYNRAVIYLLKENWNRALRDLNKAIKLNPVFSNAYFNRGFLKKQLKDYKGAMEDFNFYIKFKPNDASIYINRGNLFMIMGQFSMAIEDYNHALNLDQSLSTAYLNRGNSHIISGNMTEGCQDLTKATELGNVQAKTQKLLYCD